MNYHIEESNVAVTSRFILLFLIEDIPSALKDIWGKNDATGILLRIAKSVGRGRVFVIDSWFICV